MKTVLFVACCFALLLGCNNPKPSESTTTPSTETAKKDMAPQPAEFADPKYVAIGKKGWGQLASGDIDGWMSSFADNAVYVWSSGDSLAGKPAITQYWKDRRTKTIDSLKFMNEVWLPIKVNQAQSIEQSGNWLLSWHQVDVKYKNGKKLNFWTHTDMHFDSNDKIDRVIQYIDRAPINAALGIK